MVERPLSTTNGEGVSEMSKMKQHLESEIVIKGSSHEDTAWKRYIRFEYEGNSYELTLFWDEFNGYEIYWQVPNKTPDWVVNWNQDEYGGMSFQWYLDDLTWEMNK
jgi:hypothetical protein